MQKNEVEPLYHIQKFNSEQIKDLNIREKTIQLREENMEEKLHDFRLGNDFLERTPKEEI